MVVNRGYRFEEKVVDVDYLSLPVDIIVKDDIVWARFWDGWEYRYNVEGVIVWQKHPDGTEFDYGKIR